MAPIIIAKFVTDHFANGLFTKYDICFAAYELSGHGGENCSESLAFVLGKQNYLTSSSQNLVIRNLRLGKTQINADY